ncbi:MAG: hypothetical protein ACTSQE_03675 [Candidatus Heimdallarchaeaceae archaeon]
MPEITIRVLKGDDIKIEQEMSSYAFYPSPREKMYDEEKIPFYKDDYVVALFEDTNPQSVAISIPLTQNVRENILL